MTVVSRSPEETIALAERLGAACPPGTVIALVGDLGAGKTRFVQGLARGLGVPAGTRVTSPTFVLMNLYPGRVPLAHFDLYRTTAVDLESLGFDDVRNEAVAALEWADRVEEARLGDHLRIEFEVMGETSRRLMFHARGERSANLLRSVNLGE
jgi:tRNA threonylcarbamoyladenosine biosynthesis protein TsaE